MKKLVWAVLCLFSFSTCVMAAEGAADNSTGPATPAESTTPPADAPATTDATTTEAATDETGLSTGEMVMIGAAVVGAGAIIANNNNSSTSHH
jgi:hypothetical protein